MLNLKNRDFIDLMSFTKEELEWLMDFAENIKSGKDKTRYLDEKNLGLLFSVASTRTRISFQVGARQMGGHAEFYNSSDLQLSNNESLIDTAKVMERYLDALIVRMYDMKQYGKGREAMNTLTEYANIPIINALDDKDHPCQVLGDILTMKEKFGEDYKKKKVVFTWGYAKRQKSLGVPHSLMSAGATLGMNIVFAYPKGFDLDEQYIEFARKTSQSTGARIEFCNDLMEASEGADIIYQKNWKGINMEDAQELRIREEVRHDWCVSMEHFKRANPGAVYMDCLPVIRGEGVTSEVIDGDCSIVYDEAENRLHIQKAIMAALL